jgi:hypothetical protein
MKSISSYAEDNLAAPISRVTYYYKQSGSAGNGSAQLVTSALTINENNQIAVKAMSRDIDLSVDVKESITEAETFGNTFLLEIGLKLYTVAGSPPTEVTLPYLKTLSNDAVYGEERYGLNTTSMTKVVQQYGILDKIESFDNKSKTTIQNLLWDKNTGEVLLTKETNHLDQSVYNFNYPAYWPYSPMGHEFQRDNIQILCSSTVTNPIWTPSTGILTQSILGTPSIVKHGDEVRLYTLDANGTPTSNISNPAGNDNRYWAITNYTSALTASVNMVLLDKNGVVVDLNSYPTLGVVDYMIKIVKPIEKNDMVAKAGYVTSKVSPINSSAISITPSLNIVDAGVQEFCRGNSIYFNNTVMSQSLATAAPNYSSASFNEIITGFYGTFRPSSTYKYNVDRKYSTSQPTIYSDGYYSTFSPYWAYTTQWGKNIPSPSDNRWIRINNAKYYSPHGNLIESENANLVSTSQRQCYNHTLPALTAHNAKGDEIGFDSFEDYTVYTALVTNSTNVQTNDYIGMYKALSGSGSPPALTGTSSPVSHTGRYSLSFAPSNTLTLEMDYMKSLQIPPYNVDQWTNCTSYIMDCSKLNLRTKKYLVSMWVKGPPSSSTFTSIVNFSVSGVVTAMSTPTITAMTSTLVSASPIINGWQKLDYEAAVTQSLPAMYDAAVVNLQIYSGATSFYIDDLRIQPSNSSMTCNVYDPISMRLWAQLDERNYATLLEYDSEGMLVRKKKETQKGIYTTQETRKGIVKN